MSPEEKIRFLSEKLEEESRKNLLLEKALAEKEHELTLLKHFADPKGVNSGGQSHFSLADTEAEGRGIIWMFQDPQFQPLVNMLFESLSYAMLLIDSEGTIVMMNRHFGPLFHKDIKKEDFVGNNISFYYYKFISR